MNDQDVREALGTVAREVTAAPDAWARIERGIRARRRRRAATGALLVVLAAGVGTMAGTRLSGEPPGFVQTDVEESATYSDPLGWSWRYPRAWDDQVIDQQDRVTQHVVRVANVDLGPDRTLNPQEAFYPERLTPSPAGVIIEMLYQVGGPPPIPNDVPDTTFPLSLESAEPQRRVDTGRPWRSIPIWIDGTVVFTVNIWMGPEASDADIQAARDVVASIRVTRTGL